MNNRELYKRSFEKLRPTEKFQKEINIMMDKNQKTQPKAPRRVLALAAAVVAILSLTVAASATGMFRNVRLWIDGEEVAVDNYLDENGDLYVEVEGEGRTDVLVSDELGTETDAEVQYAPAITVEYEKQDGDDCLCFTNKITNETETLDVTDKLVDGHYQDTVTLFGCVCQVELTIEGDSVSTSINIKEIAE